jgi:hypothetical protein
MLGVPNEMQDRGHYALYFQALSIHSAFCFPLGGFTVFRDPSQGSGFAVSLVAAPHRRKH